MDFIGPLTTIMQGAWGGASTTYSNNTVYTQTNLARWGQTLCVAFLKQHSLIRHNTKHYH